MAHVRLRFADTTAAHSMRRGVTVARPNAHATAFPAARCRSFATKPPNPRVFFDVSVRSAPKGRITFEVRPSVLYWVSAHYHR